MKFAHVCFVNLFEARTLHYHTKYQMLKICVLSFPWLDMHIYRKLKIKKIYKTKYLVVSGHFELFLSLHLLIILSLHLFLPSKLLGVHILFF